MVEIYFYSFDRTTLNNPNKFFLYEVTPSSITTHLQIYFLVTFRSAVYKI